MSQAKTDKRRIGTAYEELAARYLEDRGMRVLARNFRVRIGEIDLIMMDGDTLVFVEVKYRSRMDFGGAEYAIPPGKQARIRRVAEWYRSYSRIPADTFCRFDAVLINGSDVIHIPDAWQ